MSYRNIALETCENDLAAISTALSYFINSTIELRGENSQLTNEIAALNSQLSSCCSDFHISSDFLNL